MAESSRTPITPFRFQPDTLADLDYLAGSLSREEGRTVSRAEAVRLLARRERARREKAERKNLEKSGKSD